ncbi:MAG: hypothetical protein O7C75_01850, partial [Verrucomicrobia bacterium]|nr:hypothetical protein [Verrucomicrobiota bacterium]
MNQVRCAAAFVFPIFVFTFSLFGQNPEDGRIQSMRYEDPTVFITMRGENGESVAIETTTDLFDWELLTEITFAGTSFIFEDTAALPGKRRFYRAYHLPSPMVNPTEAEVLAGDTILFEINADGQEGTWTLAVDGIEDGNAIVGFVFPHESNPNLFFYRAPGLTENQTFKVTATNSKDSSIVLEADVTVLGIGAGAEIVIKPNTALVPVGSRILFQAGLNAAEFIPFKRGFWHINGELHGNFLLGSFDQAGLYIAPPRLLANLPEVITIQYSSEPESPILATADVTLVDMDVLPDIIQGFKNDIRTVPVTVFLSYSNGDVEEIPHRDVDWGTEGDVASTLTTRFSGDVRINDWGKDVVFAEHLDYFLTDTIRVESRPYVVVIQPEAQILSGHYVKFVLQNLGSSTDVPKDLILPTSDRILFDYSNNHLLSIEVTSPRVLFELIPQTFISTATNKDSVDKYKLSRINQDLVDGISPENITFTGDDNLIINYNQFLEAPPTTDILAKIEHKSGLLTIGDTPGTGTVTVNFDNGFDVDSASIEVTYSRLLLEVDRAGSETESPTDIFITENMKFDVKLINPNGDGFMGRTPIRITLNDIETFVASYLPNEDGTVNLFVTEDFGPTRVETHKLILQAQQRDFTSETVPGGFAFALHPQRDGEHRVKIEVADDPGVEPVEIVFNVVKPQLIFEGVLECFVKNGTGKLQYEPGHPPVSPLDGTGEASEWHV